MEVGRGRKGEGFRAELISGQSLPGLRPLPLRLSCDGVHDGVLRVQADGRVVLGVDDGGFTAGALHLDWPVG